MKLKKKYSGIELTDIFDRYVLDGKMRNTKGELEDICIDDLINIMYACTAEKAKNDVKFNLIVNYPYLLNANYENEVRQWIRGVSFSNHQNFIKLLKTNWISQEFKDIIINQLIVACYYNNAKQVYAFVGEQYKDNFVSRFCSVGSKYEDINVLIELFGVEETSELFFKYFKNLGIYFTAETKISPDKIYNLIQKFFDPIERFPIARYNTNTKINCFYKDHKDRKEVIQTIYEIFISLPIIKDSSYFMALRRFEKEINVNNEQIILKHKHIVKGIADDLKYKIKKENINLSDAIKYLFDFMTQDNVQLEESKYDELTAYEMVLKLAKGSV